MKEFLKKEVTIVRPVWRIVLNAMMTGFIIAVIIFVTLNTPQISNAAGSEWAFKISIILLPLILAVAFLLSTGYAVLQDDSKSEKKSKK